MLGVFGALCLLLIYAILYPSRRIAHPKHLMAQAKGVSLLAVTPLLKKKEDTPLHVHLFPGSHFSKSILLLRNRILARQNSKKKMLLMAAIGSGESSHLITNLAIALAQGQKKVLLMDCQLKSPRQHGYFKIRNYGISEIIYQRQPLDKAISKVEIPYLDVLPAGEGFGLKTLYHEAFQSLLSECRTSYDYVLIDAPPLSIDTDTILIAQQTEGVILTISHQQVKGSTFQWAKSELEKGKIPLVGVILNDAPLHRVGSWNQKYYPEATA